MKLEKGMKVLFPNTPENRERMTTEFVESYVIKNRPITVHRVTEHDGVYFEERWPGRDSRLHIYEYARPLENGRMIIINNDCPMEVE